MFLISHCICICDMYFNPMAVRKKTKNKQNVFSFLTESNQCITKQRQVIHHSCDSRTGYTEST